MSRKINALNKMSDRGTPTKGLHDRLGIDFQKPFRMVRFTGKFTINQMRKEAEAAGFFPRSAADNGAIVLLLHDHPYFSHEMYVTEITPSGFDIEPYDGWASGLSQMHTKGSFEEKRKAGAFSGYLFMQLNKYRTDVKPARRWNDDKYTPTTKDRYKFVEFRYQQTAILMRTDNNGEKFDYRVYDGINEQNLHEYIDKSGYLVADARKELMRRLDAYKRENAKKAYLAQDYTERVKAIRALVNAKKRLVADKLTNAATSKEIDEIWDAIGWHGLYSAYDDLERMEKHTREKSYDSIEQFERDYNRIVERIATI